MDKPKNHTAGQIALVIESDRTAATSSIED